MYKGNECLGCWSMMPCELNEGHNIMPCSCSTITSQYGGQRIPSQYGLTCQNNLAIHLHLQGRFPSVLGGYHNFMVPARSGFHKIIYKGSRFRFFFLKFTCRARVSIYVLKHLSRVSQCRFSKF